MTVRNRHRYTPVAALALLLAAASTVGLGTTAAAAQSASTTRSAGDPVQLVVKVVKADGCSIHSLDSRYPLVVDSPVLASRGIYQVHSADAKYQTDDAAAQALADELAKLRCVVYAELDADMGLADTRFHSWRFHSWGSDSPEAAGSGSWTEQPAVKQLALSDAHRAAKGAGVTVAVLDTGIDASHPAFAGKIAAGYDFVGDDSDPSDVASSTDSNGDGYADTAVGHGTFAAGLVTLVAPSARVMPMRVLDSDGNGNLFVIAQAVWEATEAGVQVINLSFGSDRASKSQLLTNAIRNAYKNGVVVVAAAGNGATSTPTYPAMLAEVVSVGALSADAGSLASFSNSGKWVSVAAPGTDVVGPVPGNRFAAWSGTSMAAPFVAGQMALVASIDKLSAKSDATALKRQANVKDSANSLAGVAYGRINLVGSIKLAKQP